MKLNHNPVPVTVVIPCHACAATIERAVTSVVSQTRGPAEIILIDDASTDHTWTKLTELASAYPGWIKLLRHEKNQGVANARNAGWAAASQPYIAFLDADDAWHPEKLAIQYAYMKDAQDVALCGHGHRILQNPAMKPDWDLDKLTAKRIHKWSLLLANSFITPSVMLRRDIRQRFSEGQRHMEDRLLWLEIVCDGGRVDCLKLDLAATYKVPYGLGGLSSNLWQMTSADMDNYRVLWARGKLSRSAANALRLFSLLKFFRRIAKVAVWRLGAALRGSARRC